MHEMGIVQSIMEILEQQAAMYQVKKIVRINLEFGALTAVMPDAVRFAFDILSKDTVADGAELDIKIIPIKVHCIDCSNVQIMEVYQPFCPSLLTVWLIPPLSSVQRSVTGSGQLTRPRWKPLSLFRTQQWGLNHHYFYRSFFPPEV